MLANVNLTTQEYRLDLAAKQVCSESHFNFYNPSESVQGQRLYTRP